MLEIKALWGGHADPLGKREGCRLVQNQLKAVVISYCQAGFLEPVPSVGEGHQAAFCYRNDKCVGRMVYVFL